MIRNYVSIVNKDPFVLLYYRENGVLKTEQRKITWYFSILKIDSERPQVQAKIRQLIVNPDRTQRIFKTVIIGNYCLIYCSKYSPIPTMFRQMKIQTFEDDLSLTRRFWLDSNLNLSTEYKIAFFDIETDDTIAQLSVGRDTILSFAIKDLEGNEFFYSLKDFQMSEKRLLEKFIEIIDNYDLISGWNSWKFDLPYIKTRMLMHNVEWRNERRIAHIDLQQRMIHSYRFDSRIKSFSLDYIAKRFIGRGKIQRTTKTIDLFKNDYELFKEYNLTDARLLYELENKNKILDVLLKQAVWCNTFPKEISPTGKSIYRLLDNLILRISYQHQIRGFSPKFTSDQIKGMTEKELAELEYPGGYVMTPVQGCHNNVYNFDFKSLYPSIIRTWNIGLDTRVAKPKEEDFLKLNKNPEGSYYLKEPRSIISDVLEFLLEKRKFYKQRILKLTEEGQTGSPEYESAHADEVVVKELSNSIYGISGRRDGRYFSKEVASSITLAGQWLVKSFKRFAENKGFLFLYGDTDSGVIQSNESLDLTKFLQEFHEWLKEELKREWNIDPSYVNLEFDRYYKRYILVDKKNYTGWVLNQEHKKTNYIYTRGLEVVKSSTCPLASRSQEELINKLLKEDNTIEYYQRWVLDKKEHVFENITRDDLVLTNKVNKGFSEYKNKTLPVLLAEKKLQRDGILLNREIQYIITNTQPKLEGVEVSEWNGVYDKIYYWDRAILPCLDRLLRVTFPSIEWKKTYRHEQHKTRQKKLKI